MAFKISHNEQKAIQTTYMSIAGSALLAIGKGLTGFFGNSYALIADAIESTTDIFASILVLFGIKYASKPADDNHPYGHGRAEPLITFLVVAFLVGSAIVIAYHSIILIQTSISSPNTPFPFSFIPSIKVIHSNNSYAFPFTIISQQHPNHLYLLLLLLSKIMIVNSNS